MRVAIAAQGGSPAHRGAGRAASRANRTVAGYLANGLLRGCHGAGHPAYHPGTEEGTGPDQSWPGRPASVVPTLRIAAMKLFRRILRIALWLLAALVAGSLLSLYAYGRFAERARGEEGHALAPVAGQTAIDRWVEPLLAAHPERNGLALQMDNVDAFAARALSARAAGRSLDLMYYLWHDDLSGRLLLAEALAAADRGVRVRLLLDDINAHDKDATLRIADDHPNVEVRMFNPSRNRGTGIRRAAELLTRAISLNRRMHNKAWIADNRIALVGGRNIGDEYFDAAAAVNFLDADLALVGPAVAQTSAIFDRFWNSEMVIPIAALAKRPGRDLDDLRARLAHAAASDGGRAYLDHVARSHGVDDALKGEGGVCWSGEVAVVSDPADKATDSDPAGWLITPVVAAIDKVHADLRLMSPYFVPGEEGLAWLLRLRERGARIAVATNSLAATDVVAVHGGYAPYRHALLRAGVELYELMATGPVDAGVFGSSGASLHTKAFTVDDALGFVGSLNFDPRSINLNTEMGVLFACPDLVVALQAAFDAKTGADTSYRLWLDGEALRWEDRRSQPPRQWTREPEASAWRRGLARLAAWLPIESQL